MYYINLTHIPVQVNGITIPPSGQIAEFDEARIWQGTINGFDKYKVVGGTITGLPKAKEGVSYIVTHEVKKWSHHRDDVFSLSVFWSA